MDVKVATVDMTINGNFLNAVDIQNHLGCELFILKASEEFVSDYIKLTKTIYRPMRALPYRGHLNCDVLIVDYKAFLYILIHQLNVNCDKIIVMDCLELSLHQQLKIDNSMFLVYGASIPDVEMMCSLMFPDTEIQFLMPKVNHDLFKYKFKHDIFHKKINFDIITFPKIKNSGYVYRSDVIDDELLTQTYPEARKILFGDELYESRNFIYNRRSHLSYIEQFGRILFELYYFDRNVWLTSDNALERGDGLSEHLQLLGAYMLKGRLFIPNIEDMNMNNYNYLDKYL